MRTPKQLSPPCRVDLVDLDPFQTTVLTRAAGCGFEVVARVRSEYSFQLLLALELRVEPNVVVIGREYHWHTVVARLHQLVRLCDDDRAGPDLAVVTLPMFRRRRRDLDGGQLKLVPFVGVPGDAGILQVSRRTCRQEIEGHKATRRRGHGALVIRRQSLPPRTRMWLSASTTTN